MNFFNKFLRHNTRFANNYFKFGLVFAGSLIVNDNKTNLYCPKDYPYFCDKNTNSFGLCKKNKCDCNDINIQGVIPIIKDNLYKEGENFGYYTDNLHKRCNQIYLNHEYNENIYGDIPNEFKIVTYNIWGLFKKSNDDHANNFIKKTMEMRMKEVSNEITKNDPDIICFQEMTDITYQILNKEIGHKYAYKYEKDFNHEKVKLERNRDVEVCIFSKYPIKNTKIYGLSGNQRYNDSLMIAEFPNLIIFNCYLQSGSIFSPGQENLWFHYSRCRIDQIREIKKIIDDILKKDINKPIIMLGDFNFHLDGDKKYWIETHEFNNFLQDSWKKTNHNNDGFTENTDINRMRWNLKLHEKKVRYDGILYKNIIPLESHIIGNKPIKLNESDSEDFKKYILKNNINLKYSPDDNKSLELFPSDHFGVITKFKLN
jgi:exonuclease III